MKLFVFLSLFIIALTLSTTSGWAQEAMEEGDFIAAPDITLETFEQEKTDTSEEQKPDSSKAEITVIEDKYAGQYVEASLENISKIEKEKLKADLLRLSNLLSHFK